MTDDIPSYPGEHWPSAPSAHGGRSTGYLREANPSTLPKRLEQFKTLLRSIHPNEKAFEVYWTDSDGVTVYGILVISETDRLHVTRVLVDGHFDE
jgi:hypothetical protein